MSQRPLMRERILASYVEYNPNRIGLRNSNKSNNLKGDSDENFIHNQRFFFNDMCQK